MGLGPLANALVQMELGESYVGALSMNSQGPDDATILTLIAQPPGWLMGYGLAWVMKTNLAGELMRVRLVVEHSTYVVATAVVVLAAIASAFVIRERIDRLDLVAVLKTRD